jgi:hypothetical protein
MEIFMEENVCQDCMCQIILFFFEKYTWKWDIEFSFLAFLFYAT